MLGAISAPERSKYWAQFQGRIGQNLERNFRAGKVKILGAISGPDRSKSCARFQASAAVRLRVSLFWVVNTAQVGI
jgi:hypothetical protein